MVSNNKQRIKSGRALLKINLENFNSIWCVLKLRNFHYFHYHWLIIKEKQVKIVGVIKMKMGKVSNLFLGTLLRCCCCFLKEKKRCKTRKSFLILDFVALLRLIRLFSGSNTADMSEGKKLFSEQRQKNKSRLISKP